MKHYGAVDDPKDITTKEYVDAADNALKVKVDALWDFVCTDITSNPFQITFDDLEGLTVRSGIWNTGQRRLELALPCSCCKREDGVIVIQGKTYDGSSARVTIKGEEVRYYGKQRTLAAIRAGQCRPPALRP